MINNVNLNTPEGKKNYFVKQGIINGAIPATVGLGIASGVDFLMKKAAMKDEFKSANSGDLDSVKVDLQNMSNHIMETVENINFNIFLSGKIKILPNIKIKQMHAR